MGKFAAAVVASTLVAVGVAQAAADRPIIAGAVAVRATDEWSRVPLTATDDSDPRTVLVIGTRGVAPMDSECQVAAYRIPVDGAAVVVLRWRGAAPDGLPRDRSELQAMRLKRPLFECFDGRGAVAQIVIKNHAYQVNVLVGDRATRDTASDALAIARSFAAAP
jgi:hypothetical protein